MAIAYEDAVLLRDELENDYRDRHQDFRTLRNFWQGKHWQEIDAGSQGLASLFRDMRKSGAEVGPEFKVVHNVLKEVVDKYQTFLSPLPQIQVYADPPESQKRRAAAVKKERFLYGCWSENVMSAVLGKLSWYLPVFGDAFLGIWPDFDTNVPRVIVRSPEYAYPFRGFDGDMKGVIFNWKVRESVLKRNFPDYQRRSDRRKGRFLRGQPQDPEVDLIEYSDGREFARWADDQKLNGVEHNLGFNLFDQLQFLHEPDEVWGHGAIEQYVGLNVMGNTLKSLLFKAVFDSVFPTLVLINPSKFSENLEIGTGGVVGVNEGGDAKYLQAPSQGVIANTQFALQNDQTILTGAGIPPVTQGMSPASSIVTGKAVNELQGAGTGSMIEHVQALGIGRGLVLWNEKAITMAQTMFRDDRIHLFGVRPETNFDLVPQRFAWSGKGSDLVGSPRNEVIFSPHMSDHEKLVMGLQAAGGGLVSKEWQRNNIGIPDSQAMTEQIIVEALEEGVLGAIIQNFMQEPTPEGAADVEKKTAMFLGGESAPHPLVAQTLGPGAMPTGGPPMAPPGGPAPAGPSPAPPGAPPPPGAPAPAPPQQGPQNGGALTLNDVAPLFQNVQGVKGRVFLVGEIVVRGETRDDVEVALTEDDREAIARGIPQLADHFVFHHVDAEPTEEHVEVTPGTVPQQGGEPAPAVA